MYSRGRTKNDDIENPTFTILNNFQMFFVSDYPWERRVNEASFLMGWSFWVGRIVRIFAASKKGVGILFLAPRMYCLRPLARFWECEELWRTFFRMLKGAVHFEAPWNASLPPLSDVVVGGGLVEAFAFLATPPPENQAGRRLGFNQADA